jgi:hypothetical protein
VSVAINELHWNERDPLIEVLLPDSATPIHPRTGATRMKATPILENALASEAAMPEKL